ncbi:hypothetical protein ACFPT7_22190 [Acidicapsa dinghuensis]|uniref:Uncharacterized protein n=1 Tax=Acidicapsa dinghuensis TaxID=2218256 RepID=A0ABW1ELW4_9BACT|nr:hypothetical protein [Acidicapsa dinghuensis]
MRIERYQSLLGSKDEFRLVLGDCYTYIDLNYPRSKPLYPRDDFPQLRKLLADLERHSIGLVLIDLQETFGISESYSWIRHTLTNAGVRVVNAFYDSEDVLAESIAAQYRGQAHLQEIDDGSDFVNFFPALSAAIGRAALAPGLRLGERRNQQFEAAEKHFYRIGQRSPYSAGREPFIQEDLTDEWFRRVHEIRAKERTERRECEQLYRLAPRMPGLLLDEDLHLLSEVRNAEEFAKAEERVNQLGLAKVVEGRNNSYVFHGDGFDVYADIRFKPKIRFYIYRLPKQAKASSRSRVYFELHDRLTRDMAEKWRTALGTAMRRNTDK